MKNTALSFISCCSCPKLHSVNDGISKPLCSLTYVTVDDPVTKILESELYTLLVKVDIKHTFCSFPVHPVYRHLLTMEWKHSICCLPFRLRSVPKLLNILADLLSWVTMQQGVTFSMHYLDDFLMFGPLDSPVCQHETSISSHKYAMSLLTSSDGRREVTHCIPDSLRKEFLHMAHNAAGHQGTDKTIARL